MAVGRKIQDEREAVRCLRAAAHAGLSAGEWGRAHGIDGRSLRAWRVTVEPSYQGRLAARRGDPETRRVAKSREKWERVVAEYGRSGLRQGKFCERRGIALSTLQYWLRKLRLERDGGTVELVPVRVTGSTERTSGVMEARVERVALQFEVGTDPKYVAAVLHALSDQC